MKILVEEEYGWKHWLWEIDVDKPWYGNYNIVKEYIIKNKNLPISRRSPIDSRIDTTKIIM